MTTSDRAAAYVAEQGKAPVDFRLSRRDEAHWTIEPTSAVAREAAAILTTGDDALQGRSILTADIRSNALLLASFARGFSIIHHGPAGPLTL